MCSLSQKKAELRREWKAVRASVPDRAEKNRAIAEKVLTHSAVRLAKTAFLYLSFGSEVETLPILEELLRRGVRVAVPRCDLETKTMDAVEISHLSQVEKGAYGILEPVGDLPVLSPKEIDVALVPALAFDNEGFRLGYGGGYYDKFLNEMDGVTVGLAFSECLTHDLPREEFDMQVDWVITD